ncbi:hypothetical protein ACH5RR_024092 [Cinchona calisaya]|uniref:WRC domain-containing protein n=1 Tax=Cinchona calisaya TaxID=153742 RepID=A0ABD2ZCI2_9GENT
MAPQEMEKVGKRREKTREREFKGFFILYLEVKSEDWGLGVRVGVSFTTATHVCQLNQSPWDVVTFSPPHPSSLPPPPDFLVDNDHSYYLAANGIFSDHISADKSPKWDDIAAEEGFNNRNEESFELKNEEKDSVCCSKIVGKDGQCRKKAKNEQPFCEHKKSERITTRRARHKKPASSSSSNPYEFYYYSGFGPRWGKRRGADASVDAAIKEEPYMSLESSSDTSTKNSGGPNSTPEPSVKSSSFSSQFDKQLLDYVEDEDEEDDDDDYENGVLERKRARKPIKARSLKSLM